jgi:hypothetical protein
VLKKNLQMIILAIIAIATVAMVAFATINHAVDRTIDMKATPQAQNTLYEPNWNPMNPGMKLVQFGIEVTNHRNTSIEFVQYGLSAITTNGATYECYYYPTPVPDRIQGDSNASFIILFSIHSDEDISRIAYDWNGTHLESKI